MQPEPYRPTPARIKAECKAIREAWSETTERHRAVQHPTPARIPVFNELDLTADENDTADVEWFDER